MEVKRSQDVNHQNPSSNPDYSYALSDLIFNGNQLFLSSEKIPPGKKSSAPHFHQSIDEIVYIVKGEVMAYEGEDITKLGEGDFALFSANNGKKHYLENQSDKDAEFLLFRRSTFKNDVIY
jgi:uncharacterized cupin superfamily protein